MEPSDARAMLMAQHDRLRTLLARCSELARRVLLGEPTTELDEALTLLRLAFAEHNETETALVRMLLHDSPQWGALLVDRMLEEHVAEHAAFWETLSGSAAEVAVRIEGLVDELDAHMAAEERTFLSPVVLHAEAIARHKPTQPS